MALAERYFEIGYPQTETIALMESIYPQLLDGSRAERSPQHKFEHSYIDCPSIPASSLADAGAFFCPTTKGDHLLKKSWTLVMQAREGQSPGWPSRRSSRKPRGRDRELTCRRRRCRKPAYGRRIPRETLHHATQPARHSCGFVLCLHTFYRTRLVRRGSSFAVRFSHDAFAFSSCDGLMNLLACPSCGSPLGFPGISLTAPEARDRSFSSPYELRGV